MTRNLAFASFALCAAGALFATAGMAQSDAAPAHAPAAGPAADSDAAKSAAKAAFEANCAGCHELSEATTKAKSAAEWKATVEKMVGYGAPVAAEDQELIVQYLSATYPAAAS